MEIEDSKNGSGFMLLQVAYGDEANSVPLVLSYDSWKKVKCKIPSYGNPVTLKKLLVVNLTDDLYFQNKISLQLRKLMRLDTEDPNDKIIALYYPEENEKVFFIGIDKEIPCSSGEIESVDLDASFYSTSYVWLILEQIEEADFQKLKNKRLTSPICPGKCIPFFEHANLASQETLNFLQHCLVRKAIYYVIDCEEYFYTPAFYILSTALFPIDIIKIFETEKLRLNDKDRQIIETRLRVPDIKNMRTHNDVAKFSLDLAEKIRDNI